MTNYSKYLEDQVLTTHSGATASVHNFDSSGNAPARDHYSTSHTGTIGTESQITFSGTGHSHDGSNSRVVAWTNISGRPTTISSFTNDSGYKTSYCSYCTYCGYCAYCTHCTHCYICNNCQCNCWDYAPNCHCWYNGIYNTGWINC
jgi:hypothetical protein